MSLAPKTRDTKIASITKAFTAVLVFQLVEEQKIDLDQPIKHYLSSYFGEGADTVKIRMLLNHTSGLPNDDAACNRGADALANGMPHYAGLTSQAKGLTLTRWNMAQPRLTEHGSAVKVRSLD